MAEDNARQAEESGVPEIERKLDRSDGSSRPRGDQRGTLRVKDRPEEGRLPTPSPDPQCSSGATRDRSGMMSRGVEEEEEDLAVYLNEGEGASPFDGHSFDYDVTPNSTASAMGVDAAPDDVFEHLDRLYALTEEILELRDRSCKLFRRVRNLERAKAQRNADRRLEAAVANGEELPDDFLDEDTGFAESLLDAMLSSCRDTAMSAARRNERASMRSPSRQRSRSIASTEQNLGLNLIEGAGEADKRTARNANRNGGPKVSKWTRVKAAFKWERACTSDLADIVEAVTPTTRFLRIPDAVTTGSWSTGSALSPCTSELSSPSTPIGRASSASSSNEEVFDDSRKNATNVNYADRQLALVKDDRRKEEPDRHGRLLDTVIAEIPDPAELPSEPSRDKPLIRIISDADAAIASTDGKNSEVSPKKPTPILTITIPSNEEEIRNLSSPESMSPLLSSTQDSGGSSPQQPKPRQGISSPREFKRQYSTIEEAVTPAPKMQDSKWNKVRRAFLTNATFSVPPSPVRMVAPQLFPNDDTRRARSCSESVEDLGKTVAGTSNNQAEASKDYQALREKFGAEFHRKLVEWERLKSARNARSSLPWSEERLAPEFRKKLQEWKRAKKGRRSSVAVEQQRVSRRRLTDWQLWRTSSSKPETKFHGKNHNSVGSRGSCASIGSAGSFGSDGKQHLCEDFIKRMEAWRRMSEAACQNNERPKSPVSRTASDIDETEFVALEKVLLLFEQKPEKERRESDAKQLNDCFDGDSRFMNASRGVNCGNEVLIRTSVGSYRFEGISREFTRKLYDWEKYRGISPRSSTFRLLGPGYTPFTEDSDEAMLAEPSSTPGKNRAFHLTLKRSKSDGSVFEGSLRDESFTLRRSTSLQSLSSADKLEDDNRLETLPVSSNNSQGMKDHAEDIAVEDSEPEAMIVDIEDVIEETASPLTGVQPHQTPVYSVAASETTSIAVPLGTVTSSHEPSPVFLVEAEENESCERWNGRTWQIGPEARSSENSPSPERSPVSEDWHETVTSLDEDKSNWESWRKESNKEDDGSTGWTEKTRNSIPDSGDSVKSDQSIGWNRDAWDESGDEANRDSTGLELPLTPIYESKSDTKKHDFFESDEAESANSAENFETSLRTLNAEELMDSPRTSRRMNETRKLETLADEPSNEQTSDVEDLQDGEKTERRRIILDTYQLTRTPSSSDCRDSKEASPKLSNLNLDDNKDIPEYCGVDIEDETSAHYENCSSPELQADVDRHYEILTFKTDTCGDATDNRLYEPINCPEIRSFSYDSRNNCAKGNLLSSRLPGMEKSNYLETSRSLLTNSIIRTIPITVSRDNEARRLERILINEETLNKIIVPTASTDSGMRSAEKIRDRSTNAYRPDEAIDDRQRVCNHASAKTIRDNPGFSKNVFVKTKRMIFGPFRRSEDRSLSRKESDGSVDSRLLRSKSKSKSRSASPKLSRQDALLRVSLSLPWPLRSASKESEIPSKVESRRNSGSKTDDMAQEKNSLCEENNVDNKKRENQLIKEEPLSINANERKNHHSNTNACSKGTIFTRVSDRLRAMSIEQDQSISGVKDEIKYNQTQDNEERGRIRRNQVQFEGKQNEEQCSRRQNEGKREEIKFGKDEAKQQDENHAKCDAVPSDLMHKLRILSDAAAKKEGRVIESSITNSLESRSSRIRRAKENFLSRRGGPFCRSTMEPADAVDHENPSRRTSTTETEAIKSQEVTVTASKSEETENRTNAITTQDETASSSEDKVDARQEAAMDVATRPESLVKSASAGMINIDPDMFDQLVTADRGCESLPRTIAKRRDSSGPLAKIVGKLKISRLIRARNTDGNNMSTISTLCRQSLMINMQNDPADRRNGERKAENDSAEAAKDENKDDEPGERSKRIHE
nr:PREDICTED: uncharacterized protein LOC105671710 isoform X1 [Linepithema humile]